MKWPNHADYSEAVQNPEVCFDDVELRGAVVATSPLGLPRALSGNFATVYEVKTGSGTHAIRCFIRQVTNQQLRYAALYRYLAPLNLSCMVPFEFINHGIRVLDRVYPMVKMDWVVGSPLHTWLERNLGARERIAWLAADWRSLMNELKDRRIGHGDLQHGNVLVSEEGELKLVDYDGMYIPLFSREPSPELGHANFQHPDRTASFYDERLDHFPALLIYLSLRALAAEPALWPEFFNGDNLLATAVDLRVPRCSGLWPRLLKSPDEDVRRLTVLVTDYLRLPPAEVPDLETVLLERMAGTCVPSHLTFEDPEVAVPAFSTTVRGAVPSAAPGSGKVVETPASGDEPVPRPVAVDFLKLVEVLGWSALVMAACAWIPQLRTVASTSAVGLALLAWLVPGRRWQLGRVVASTSAALGLLATLSGPQVRVEARRTTSPVPAVDSIAPMSEPAPFNPAAPVSGEVPIVISKVEPLVERRIEPPAETAVLRPFLTLKHRWQAHSGAVSGLLVTDDGRHLVSSSADRAMAIHDLERGETRSIQTNLSEPILNLASLTNVGIVASVNAAHRVQWWSLDGGVPLKTLSFNPDSVFVPAISPDSRLIAVGGGDRRSLLLHFDQAKFPGRSIPGFSSWIKLVRFSRDSRIVAVACHDDTITLLDVESGVRHQALQFADANLLDVEFSPSGDQLAATGGRGAVRVWSTSDGRTLMALPESGRHPVGLGFVGRKQQLIVGWRDGGISRHLIKGTGNQSGEWADIETGGALTAVAVSPGAGLVICGGETGEISIWNPREPAPADRMELARP